MKKLFFYILSLFLPFLFFYLFFFIYFFFTFEKDFKYNFKDIESLNFYKKYSKLINHLRFQPDYKYNLSPEEQLFTKLNNSNQSKKILLQGDSWIEVILKRKKAKNYFLDSTKGEAQIINAGISSYSPSLMNVQFDILEKDFNIKPEILLVYIDQTDIGDEICRYKSLRKIDKNGNLIKVSYEDFPIYKGPFNLHEIMILSEIDINTASRLAKTHKYLNYKFTKTLNRINKIYQKEIKKNYPHKKCGWEQIESYLLSADTEDIQYFKDILKEFFLKLDSKSYLKKIIVLTHPHKLHLTSTKYKTDVSDLVKTVAKDFTKIQHVNFTEIIKKTPDLYENVNNIWLYDQIHLDRPNYLIFIKEVLKITENFK